MKFKNLPRQLTGKEFSFEKNEIGGDFPQFMSSENNMTAHFNKNNAMSKQKESQQNFNPVSEFKEFSRPHYHCHFTN